jgi:SAM-dependent methyltransferase
MTSEEDDLAPANIGPWSQEYLARRGPMLRRALDDSGLLECFRSRRRLPNGYGIGIDERCVEYPWLLAQLSSEREKVLDAGSTLNHEFILKQPLLRNKNISILTLAPEGSCFWQLGVNYVFHDLRDIPWRDRFFDTIICASTLEHIGFDNAFYAGSDDVPVADGDFRTALREMNRVLRPGGLFLLTVPFGRREAYHEFQQFDRSLLDASLATFGHARVVEAFYRYTADGWQLADAESCADCEYVPWEEAKGRPTPADSLISRRRRVRWYVYRSGRGKRRA